MKRNGIIAALLLAVASLAGCNKDFLNRAPLDAYSNGTLWTTVNDATVALNGCYHNWESGSNIIYYDCFTDNAYDQYPWEGFEPVAQGNATPVNTGSANRWNYKTVQKCNWFLENIDKTPMDAALKKRMKAEARFLRDYQYFAMSQLYGDVPLILRTVSLDSANLVKQTPKQEIIKFLLDELTSIAADLPLSYTGTDQGRITRGAALALMARIQLFNADYQGCIVTCKQLMNSPFAFDLFTSYSDLFRPAFSGNKEVILDVQYLKTYNSFGDLGVLPPNSKSGQSSVAVTQNMVDAYEMSNGKTIDDPASGYDPVQPFVNRDPRLDATVLRPGLRWENSYFNPLDKKSPDYYQNGNCPPTGYNSKKFISHLSEDFDDIWNVGLNFIVIRYAEILLSYAESKIETGEIDASVYDAIDKVRTRAGLPPVDRTTYNDQASLRKLIRRERRVEFAMEGLRWYDVQRWKIGADVLKGQVTGSLNGSVNPNTGALTLDPASRIRVGSPRNFDPAKHYLWPVPQKEIDLNKNLKQNPNY
ncbi:RagB/SusD family nutrient uptake outer membrane protein [Chitinophaga sp. G-6-1-13]|uniref:RagB/SusD family nutrient uptake outer membrane protein n=1 Tax=Chitinophaga fulva TaxID=2728842 RepID=A0A848GN38_9BACT|nr:RagB/SusD family nutrient uptake outer membrane protein [Chitinophaga fulva]NML38799.1 RagB/SusD family nutrient uptake outer membrane protein [Chitinophaga fulva]